MAAIEPKGPNTDTLRRRNKAVVRRMIDCFNTGDMATIDDLVHPDLLDLTPPPGMVAGLAGLKEQVKALHEQFPDVHFEDDGLIAEGDTVILRWKMTGTNTGPIYGRAPTGKRIVHTGHEILRLQDGKIIEHQDTSDVMVFLDKLGLLDNEMLTDLEVMGVRSYEGQVSDATLRRNKAVVRQITKAFNSGNTRILEALVHPNVQDLSECPGIEATGIASLKQQIPMLHEQFPDLRFEEEDIVAEGDTVILRWKMTGTNTGPILGRGPTGKQITHSGTEIVRLKDGKIVEHKDTADVLEFLDKLGILDDAMMQHLEKIKFRPIK